MTGIYDAGLGLLAALAVLLRAIKSLKKDASASFCTLAPSGPDIDDEPGLANPWYWDCDAWLLVVGVVGSGVL